MMQHTPVYSDAYIESMGQRFCELNLYCRYGVRFDTYLLYPDKIEANLKFMLPFPKCMQELLRKGVAA